VKAPLTASNRRSKPFEMSSDDEAMRELVGTLSRALHAAGYVSEPDPANNTWNAPAYLKVFCRDIPKRRRVDFLNLVFDGLAGERVRIEGEDTVYRLPDDLKRLVERIAHNLPCSW